MSVEFGGRVFDRLVEFDERSRQYPIKALLITKKKRSYTWSCPVNLDQGSEGACTGFSVAHEAAARPKPVAGVTNDTARAIYHRAQQLDEWPGENYEGSSVLGAIKAGSERGWYDEYRWAFSEEDLCLAVGYKGPAVLGINWYEGMMDPDYNGIIVPVGSCVGGHAILCNGYSVKTGFYRLHNSWGSGWGVNGDCFIYREDLADLLRQDGEACIPVLRHL
jgi:hypothetical protein